MRHGRVAAHPNVVVDNRFKAQPCHDLIAGSREVGPDVVDAKRDAHGLQALHDTNHARGLKTVTVTEI